MVTDNIKQEDLIYLAKRTHRYCELLIEQCDSWLPEEEGQKNLEKRYSKLKKRKWLRLGVL